MVTIFLAIELLLSPRRPCCGRLLHTEGKVVSAGPWRCSIYLDRIVQDCVLAKSSQDFQVLFDIVLR